jgi:hypothetical protein
MFQSARNKTAIAALVAVGKAQIRLPGFDRPRAMALAYKLEAVMKDTRTMECTFALVLLLLKAVGVTDFADESRFSTRN